jgi:hypothetical protein
MSASASKNAPQPEKETKKETKKRKLASSRKSNPRKRQKDVVTFPNLGPAKTPPKVFKFIKAPAPSFHKRIERVKARHEMAGEDNTTRENLQRISQLQDPEKIKELIRGMRLEDHTAAIEKTKQARLKAKHLEEVKRRSALIFEKKSGLSKTAKASHAQEVKADQEQRAKLQKTAREKGETEKERQERERQENERKKRESDRLFAEMAKLRLDAAKKNQSKPNVKVGVYTHRILVPRQEIEEVLRAVAKKQTNTEGKKKKGSKKGKKGRLGHRKNKTKRN